MSEEPSDLIETLENIRSEQAPGISADLVEEIIRIEHETLEERESTQNRISTKVESYLESGE